VPVHRARGVAVRRKELSRRIGEARNIGVVIARSVARDHREHRVSHAGDGAIHLVVNLVEFFDDATQ